MSDDYDIRDESCPQCGHGHTHGRQCTAIGCEDGLVNRYDEDPLWYDDDFDHPCDDCGGHGYFHWCPKCGFDLVTKTPAQPQQKSDANQT